MISGEHVECGESSPWGFLRIISGRCRVAIGTVGSSSLVLLRTGGWLGAASDWWLPCGDRPLGWVGLIQEGLWVRGVGGAGGFGGGSLVVTSFCAAAAEMCGAGRVRGSGTDGSAPFASACGVLCRAEKAYLLRVTALETAATKQVLSFCDGRWCRGWCGECSFPFGLS